MESRKETGHQDATSLVTGHFKELAGYSAYRSKGTRDWLLIYTVAGLGRFGHPAGEVISHPGDIFLLAPGTLHDYGVEPTKQRWELLWTHFQPRPEWLDWLNWPQAAPEASPGLMRLAITDPATRNRVRRRLTDMHHLATGSQRRRDILALNALEEVLLWCDAINPANAQARLDPRVRRAMDLLCLHVEQKISLAWLAEKSGLSTSRLAHLFQAQLRTTPQQFLELQRLNRARQLLTLTPYSIKEIAYRVGFASPFYFSLRFKRAVGISPRAFRIKGGA